MKTKTILLAVAALGLAVSTGFSQGTISFQNNAPGAVFVTTNTTQIGGTTGKANNATGVRIQLLYQPDTGGSAPSVGSLSAFGGTLGNWEAIGTAGTVGSPTAGNFGPFTDTTGNDVAAGNNVWLVAIAWNGAYTSLAASQAGNASLYGISTVWSQATGGNGTPAATAVSTTPYFSGLVLTPTPEPATIALGGLGAAALLLFRRRK